MQFATLTTLLAAGSAFAAPAPAAEPIDASAAIEARAPTALIDLWQDANFLGLKFTGSAELEECKNLPSNFNDITTSGKARPGFRCTIWVNKDCKADGFSFDNNGVKQLPSWINDKASSWKCVKA